MFQPYLGTFIHLYNRIYDQRYLDTDICLMFLSSSPALILIHTVYPALSVNDHSLNNHLPQRGYPHRELNAIKSMGKIR